MDFKDVKEFTISRERWARGKSSCLLNSNNRKMCCLGFYSLACGIPEDEIENQGEPMSLDVHWDTFLLEDKKMKGEYLDATEFVISVNTADCTNLIHCNDNSKTTDEEKEKTITEIFAKHDIKVTFVD